MAGDGWDGRAYAQRFADLAATGASVHGEADFVTALAAPGARILDAGCGTGRVAIELATRGFDVVGADRDASMLAQARRAAPSNSWVNADLASLDLAGFDLTLLAGNVMVFLSPGTEQAVVDRVAGSVRPGGLVVAGFRLDRDLSAAAYDALCAAAGLELVERFATWDRRPFDGGEYSVSAHRKP